MTAPVLASLTLLVPCLAGLPMPARAQAAAAAGQPTTAEVQMRRLTAATAVGGTIVPVREITFTAQMPGRVKLIAGAEGARFRKGAELVVLDEEALRAQRRAAQAQIANAEATLRNAGVQFSRELQAPSSQGMGMPMLGQMPMIGQMPMLGGQKSGIERGAEIHAYGTQIEQARSALLQAQARVQEIDAKLRDTKSIAPFDGVIVKKLVELGDPVQPGQPLINFADVGVLQIQADIPARLAVGLHVGAAVDARLDDVDKTRLQARVAQVFPVADPVRHTIRVKFDLPPGAPAAAGLYAEVQIPEPGGMGLEVPVVPRSAVVIRGGLPMVSVVAPDGRIELRLVRIGEPVDEGHVSILTGLRGGEKVLVKP